MGPRICRSDCETALFISFIHCGLIELSALHKSSCPGKSGMPLSCKNFGSGRRWCTITCFCCIGDMCSKHTVTVITNLHQQAYKTIITVSFTTLIPDAFKEKHAARMAKKWTFVLLPNLSLSLYHTFIPCMLNRPSPWSQRQLFPWSCQIVFYLEPIKEETFKTYKSKTKSLDFCVHMSSKYLAVWLIPRLSSPNLLTTESVNGKEDNYKKQILVLRMWPCVASEWNPSWRFLLVETSNSHKVRALNSTIQAIEFCVLASQGLWPKAATSPMLC